LTKGRVQQGRHNPSKEKRKSNRRQKRDIHEENNEILDLKRTDSVCPDDVCNRVRTSTSSVVDSNPLSAHVKVEAERPQRVSWFLQQQAMTPSRSYAKKKDLEDS
jgi:hypothetical protein